MIGKKPIRKKLLFFLCQYGPKMKRFSRHAPAIVLIVALAIAFVLRYIVVMQHLDMGQDIANYLATMNTVFEHDPTGMGLRRPPLIASPLKLFTLAFGSLTGAKVLGVLVSVAIGVPFYLLAKRICHPWIAVAVSVMFVFSGAYSDVLSWGYLTLIGIFFILLTFHFLLLVLEKPSKRNVILTALCASLVVGFHQVSLVFFIILMVAFLIALLIFNRKKLFDNYKPVAATFAIGGILSIPYVPTYIHLLGIQSIGGGGLSISTPHPGSFQWLLASLAIIGLIFLWRQDRNRALLLAVMLLVPLALIIFVFPPPFTALHWRAIFLIYIPCWLLVGVALSWLWSRQKLHLPGMLGQIPKVTCIALIVALLPWEIISSQEHLQVGLDFHGYLDDTRWQAVQWIGHNTEPEATIAVYPFILGWWIRGEAMRNTFAFSYKDNMAYTFEPERSLVADLILSRNQGLENGNLRLAMAYPYENAAGNPVLDVYVSGMYQDVLMFDDRQIYFLLEDGDKISLADAQNKEMDITGDGESMQAVTSYSMEGFNITRTVSLKRAEKEATLCYQIHSGDANVTKFDVPIFFSHQPISVSIDANGHSFEVTQKLTNFAEMVSVTTNVVVETEGATLEETKALEQGMISSFHDIGKDATITFHLSTDKPLSPVDAPVSHYIVPELLKDYSVDYVAVDLRPPYMAIVYSDIPKATEEWFDNCPYYNLVYSQGDIRIYQVIPSALP